MEKEYRTVIRDAVLKLVGIRNEVFDLSFDLAISGELKEWADAVPVGEDHTFTRELFEGCNDVNLKLLTELLGKVETVVDSLCNLNNIPFPAEEEPI